MLTNSLIKIICSTCFILAPLTVIKAQNGSNPNTTVRKSLKHIRQGKDTLIAITKIASNIDNPELGKRLRKKATVEFELAYEKSVLSSDQRLRVLTNQFEKEENSYQSYLALEKKIILLNKRILLYEKVEASSFQQKDNIENLKNLSSLAKSQFPIARKAAAKFKLNEGRTFLLQNNRDYKKNARKAYRSISICLNLEPNFPEADSLRKLSVEKGTVNVLIAPITTNNNSYNKMAAQELEINLDALRRKNTPIDFVRYVNNDANETDIIIYVKVFKTDIFKKKHESERKSHSKVITDEKGRQTAITCTTWEHRKSSTCQLECKILVVDKNSLNLFNKDEYTALGEYSWEDSWVTYNGNKRALSKEYKRKTNDNTEEEYPNNDTMIKGATSSVSYYYFEKIFTQLKKVKNN